MLAGANPHNKMPTIKPLFPLFINAMRRCLGLPSVSTLTKARSEKCIVVLLIGYATGSCEKNNGSTQITCAANCMQFKKLSGGQGSAAAIILRGS